MPSNHIVISGTGRAGTSFLVKYLHTCGLETHLSKNPTGTLNGEANAGLEDYPLPENLDALPYVIKSPWISFDPDLALSHEGLSIDAIIFPVRSLTEAASSRVTLQRVAMHKENPWMRRLSRSWDHWADSPGGMVFPLNVEDEKRILAVGFHNLVHYCVVKEIPIIFLDFPRFINDGEYLYNSISKVLNVDRETALRAHGELADASLVRSGNGGSVQNSAVDEPEYTALKRLLSKAEHELNKALENQTRLEHECSKVKDELGAVSTELRRARQISEHTRKYPWKYLREALRSRFYDS